MKQWEKYNGQNGRRKTQQSSNQLSKVQLGFGGSSTAAVVAGERK